MTTDRVTFGNHFRQLPLRGLCGEANHLLRFTPTNRESLLMRATRNGYFSRELVCRLIVNISNVGDFVKRTNSRRAHSFRKHPSSTRLRNPRLTSQTLFPFLRPTTAAADRTKDPACTADETLLGVVPYTTRAYQKQTTRISIILYFVDYGLHFSPIRI